MSKCFGVDLELQITLLRGNIWDLLVQLFCDFDEASPVNFAVPLEVAQGSSNFEKRTSKILFFVSVYAIWNLGSTAITSMQQLETTCTLGVLSVIKTINVFKVPIQGEKEFCGLLGSCSFKEETFHGLACKIRVLSALGGFGGRLDELFETFVVDVRRSPFGHLVPRQIVAELHDGDVQR